MCAFFLNGSDTLIYKIQLEVTYRSLLHVLNRIVFSLRTIVRTCISKTWELCVFCHRVQFLLLLSINQHYFFVLKIIIHTQKSLY